MVNLTKRFWERSKKWKKDLQTDGQTDGPTLDKNDQQSSVELSAHTSLKLNHIFLYTHTYRRNNSMHGYDVFNSST